MRVIFTLFLGFFGGFLAFFAGVPVPWLVGSLLFVLVFRNNPFLSPPPKIFSRWVRVFLGFSLGSALGNTINDIDPFTSASLFSSILFVLVVTVFGCFYFRRLKGFSSLDSFISALPGGLTFLISLSDGLGERFPKIALIHTVRMVLLLFSFSFFTYFMGGDNVGSDNSIFSSFAFVYNHDLWLLLVFVMFSGFFAEKFNVAGGDIIFPMIISAMLYNAGFIEVAMPEIVKTVAMITFGVVIGCKLAQCNFSESRSQVKSSLIFTFVIILVALMVALFLGDLFDVSYFLFFLALAPGSIPEICLIAISLGFDVGFVALIHTCRYLFIMFLGALGFHFFNYFDGKSSPSEVR